MIGRGEVMGSHGQLHMTYGFVLHDFHLFSHGQSKERAFPDRIDVKNGDYQEVEAGSS